MKHIDIHGHINFPDFDADRMQLIADAKEEELGMITVGTDLSTSKSALDLAKNHDHIWATIGMHPTEQNFPDMPVLRQNLLELAADPKVVAIGECGLDFFHNTNSQENQEDLFMHQIGIANELNKPLMLHVRNAKKFDESNSAYKVALDILNKRSKVRANFHFFAGSMEDLKRILDLGYTVSFTGVLTFTDDYDELVKYAPLGNLMTETDSPFAAPIPFRGKRNQPAYVKEVVKAIARIKNQDVEFVRETLVQNARNFFSI